MNLSLNSRLPHLLLLSAGIASPILAQNITTFQNGQVADANAVNANFNNLKSSTVAANDAATAAQAAADAAQAVADLAQSTAATAQTTASAFANAIALSGNNVRVGNGTFTAASGAGGSNFLRLEGIGDDARFFHYNNNEPAAGIEFNGFTGFNQADMSFWTKQTADPDPIRRMTIATDGKIVMTGDTNMIGRVGIGTNNPTRAKLEVVGVSGSYTVGSPVWCLGSNGPFAASSGTFTNASIYATNNIECALLCAFSDERIKQVQGVSNAARDLRTLQGIEITDYTYIDTLAHGDRQQKKVIAQQVESVFPIAVSQKTDVVPDVYQLADGVDGWVFVATNLKKGERVRLITDQHDQVHEVLEVANGKFRTDFLETGKVFVFGRQVNDFRSVDYDAIAMLNVSATQELARKLADKDKAIAALQSNNEELRDRLFALEEAVARLQPLLSAAK